MVCGVGGGGAVWVCLWDVFEGTCDHTSGSVKTVVFAPCVFLLWLCLCGWGWLWVSLGCPGTHVGCF